MTRPALSVAVLTVGLLAASCGHGDVSPLAQVDPFELAAGHGDAVGAKSTATAADSVPTAPPPFSEGIFPCSRCHEGGVASTVQLFTLNHEAHLGRGLECIDCHDPDEEGQPYPADPEFCAECHEEGKLEPGVKAYFDTLDTDDGVVTFPSRWNSHRVDPQHSRHADAEIECTECHGEIGSAPIAKPKPVTLMNRCITCHQTRVEKIECTNCHSDQLRPMHSEIVLDHAEEQRSCFGCHNSEDRDTLRLASGELVSFEESYRLCGQCHGPKLRDWRLGLHGKRMGHWTGEQEYRLCAHCHNPHDPAYPDMDAMPPPAWPRGTEPSGGEHE